MDFIEPTLPRTRGKISCSTIFGSRKHARRSASEGLQSAQTIGSCKSLRDRFREQFAFGKRAVFKKAVSGWELGVHTRSRRYHHLSREILAGAEGFEPSPSSLTVRCPTDWTTPQQLH